MNSNSRILKLNSTSFVINPKSSRTWNLILSVQVELSPKREAQLSFERDSSYHIFIDQIEILKYSSRLSSYPSAILNIKWKATKIILKAK